MKGFAGRRLAGAVGLVGAMLVCGALVAPGSALATVNCTTTCTWSGGGAASLPDWSEANNWSTLAPAASTSVTELDFGALASCDPSTDA